MPVKQEERDQCFPLIKDNDELETAMDNPMFVYTNWVEERNVLQWGAKGLGFGEATFDALGLVTDDENMGKTFLIQALVHNLRTER